MIEKHLKELLFTQDLIAVSGLGAFLCERSSSEISISNNKIIPPSKQITFNEKLQFGDEQNLVKLISETYNITEIDAQNEVFKYAGKVKYTLNTEKQYIIDELGRLYIQKDGSLAFEQFKKFNYLDDSFGLPEIYIQPIVRENDSKLLYQTNKVQTMTQNPDSEEENEDIFQDEDIQLKTKNKSGLGLYYFATIFSLFFVICTTYYLNMDKNTYAIGSFDPLSFFKSGNSETFKDNEVDISENKLLPENSEISSDEIQPEVTNETSENNSISSQSEMIEPVRVSETKQITPATKAQEIDLSNAVTSKMGKFYIIVGSFKNTIKAQNYISELISKGMNAKMIAQDGNIETVRVSAGDFDDYTVANQQKLQIISQTGTDAWILNY